MPSDTTATPPTKSTTLVGYARTSTLDQKAGLEAQRRDLEALGCDRLFIEQVSSVDVRQRHKLAEALAYLREGDTLVVTSMDRLARSTQHLLEILDQIKAKGANLRILDPDLNTGTASGELILTIMGGIAQFERSIMLERQREGIAKAKAKGMYKGRKPTARAKADEVRKLSAEGMGATAIAKEVGIGRASVYRILAARDAA